MSENVENTTEGAEQPAAEVTPAPDNVESVESAKQPKPNKFQQKQIQKYIERIRRHMGKGLTEEQARHLIAKEDYDNLSPDKKIQRLESLIASLFGGIQQDVTNLRHNDSELADAMDINFRAFAKMLLKLGVGLDEQKLLVSEAQADIEADKVRRAKEQAEEKAKQASKEATAIAEAKKPATEPAEAPAVPEGATEFSG